MNEGINLKSPYPQPVGFWVLPGSLPGSETMFATAAKPNWFHRQTMRIFLGWHWKESK